jgi:hypothetical protein
VSASKGSKTATLSNGTGSFQSGDRVVLHQTRTSDGNRAGTYEYARIAGVSGNQLTLESTLSNTFQTQKSGERAQIVEVLEYQSLQITSKGRLIAPAWNGRHGGLLAVDVVETATVDGRVVLTGRGYRGASHKQQCTYQCRTGTQGESWNGRGSTGTGRNATGGGGGTSHCASGGGGSHGTTGDPGDDGYCPTTRCNIGCPAPSGDRGETADGYDMTRRILFGGAGGEGGADEDGSYPGPGGDGGGALLMRANQVDVSGRIDASGGDGGDGRNDDACGGNGCGMAGGGGGAGGAVYLRSSSSASLGSGNVRATGGGGGRCSCEGRSQVGGTGGVGRIGLDAPSSSGQSNPPASRL